jgi:hypothetical protein
MDSASVNLPVMAASGVNQFLELLATPDLPDLGPGPRPGVQAEGSLKEKLQSLLTKSNLPPQNQQLITSLVLLWHDHAEPAHVIAQEIENADGSFVHGIVHRREPDYWNSKYWFRKVGRHPAYGPLAQRASSLLESNKPLREVLVHEGEWDAMGFIDACEHAAKKGKPGPEHLLLRQIQKIETESLLEYFLTISSKSGTSW